MSRRVSAASQSSQGGQTCGRESAAVRKEAGLNAELLGKPGVAEQDGKWLYTYDAPGLPSPSVLARGRDTLSARAVSHRTSPPNKATAVAVLGQAASASMRSQAHKIAWPIRRQLFLMAH